MKPCLRARVAFRKIQRHPIARSTNRIQRYIVRGATFGVVPTGLNDVIFHHASLSIDEAMHVIIDQASISLLTVAVFLASRSLQD